MNLTWPTLLHVEDDSGDSELLRQACRSAELHVNLGSAGDGQSAIDYLSGNGPFVDRQQYPFPNLVLLDIKLPGIGGMEVLKWIRSQAETRHLPVITLSASNNPTDVKHAFELGANSFVTKPGTYKELVELARALVHYWFEVNQTPGGYLPAAALPEPGARSAG